MFSLDRLINKAEEHQKINLYSYLNLMSIKINNVKKKEDVKRRVLEKAIAFIRAIQTTENPFEIVNKKYEKLKETYESMDYRIKMVKAELLYRGLVGTSEGFGRLVFEVGLSWDSILQLPFFPGSSVKGAAKVIADAVVGGEKDLGIKMGRNYIKRIFGYSEKQEASLGTITFHDAYPIEPNDKGLILEPDVITPIYKNNVEEHLASPNPIPFLAIASGVKFMFFLASKNDRDLNITEKILKKALEYGIGAKTLIGYSSFRVI